MFLSVSIVQTDKVTALDEIHWNHLRGEASDTSLRLKELLCIFHRPFWGYKEVKCLWNGRPHMHSGYIGCSVPWNKRWRRTFSFNLYFIYYILKTFLQAFVVWEVKYMRCSIFCRYLKVHEKLYIYIYTIKKPFQTLFCKLVRWFNGRNFFKCVKRWWWRHGPF